MTWKKHFQSPTALKKYNALQKQAENDPTTSSHLNSYASRFASWLPDVYVGQPNRIERYSQYDNMDLDTEVSGSLDTIADSCTTQDGDTKLPFEFEYIGNVSEEEVVLLRDLLRQWYEVNSFEMTLWKMFRSVLKYGDQILIRDPQTYKLYWVDHTKVESVIVDEARGKRPEQYVVRDLDLNLQTLVATGNMQNPADQRGYSSGPLASGHSAGTLLGQHSQNRAAGGAVDGQYGGSAGLSSHVNADHIVHMSLSEGMDNVWPFGTSILENVFKAYKKKELIEDAVVIYRVQRAPERRVFYVDTGRLPTHKAHAYLERVKNEIQQKRIPSRTGGNSSVLDATYNPMCVSLGQTIQLLDGRIITLQDAINEYNSGKENWVYSINQETHEMEPGRIAWAGVTRKNAEVIKVTLDNGEEVITTPDHRYIMRDGSEVEAKDLNIDDSLMPLYLLDAKTDKIQKNKTYQRYKNNSNNKIEWVHLAVTPKNENDTVIHHIDFNSMNNNPDNLIEMDKSEHTDLHRAIGSYSISKQWNNPSARKKLLKGIRSAYIDMDDDRKAMLTKRNNANGRKGREYYSKRTSYTYNNALVDQFIIEYDLLNDKNKRTLLCKNLNANDIFIDEFLECNGHVKLNTTQRQTLNFNIQRLDSITQYMGYYNYSDFQYQNPVCYKKQPIIDVSNDDVLNRQLCKILSSKQVSQTELIAKINNDSVFLKRYETISNKNCKTDFHISNGFKRQHLQHMIIFGKYNNYYQFINSMNLHNHKIASIEWLSEKIDTGDLTIESKSGNHNFALAAGIYVHNSMLEDYYFAQNADGKGSRVETLPGGDQLGEIDDLKYFNHQMRMGLRIPRSYMPDFNDGGGSLFNDGRIGTAYIEEYRYSRYCERLQNLIMPPLDTEFKLFCKHRGANIQSGLFNLRLVKPQNFSKYREIELDSATLNVYSQVADIPHISRRYGLMKYAGWNKDDVLENERMWAEENEDRTKKTEPGSMSQSSFSDVGAGGSMGDDMGEFDTGGDEFDDIELGGEEGTSSPISGDEGSIGDLDI